MLQFELDLKTVIRKITSLFPHRGNWLKVKTKGTINLDFFRFEQTEK